MLPTTTPGEAEAELAELEEEEEEAGPRVITMADITTMRGMEEERRPMGPAEAEGSGMGWGWEAWGDISWDVDTEEAINKTIATVTTMEEAMEEDMEEVMEEDMEERLLLRLRQRPGRRATEARADDKRKE
jgi:hypothetical protein